MTPPHSYCRGHSRGAGRPATAAESTSMKIAKISGFILRMPAKRTPNPVLRDYVLARSCQGNDALVRNIEDPNVNGLADASEVPATQHRGDADHSAHPEPAKRRRTPVRMSLRWKRRSVLN